MDPDTADGNFRERHRKTHKDGCHFDGYTPDIRAARSRRGIVTGLPDGYGRGGGLSAIRAAGVAL